MRVKDSFETTYPRYPFAPLVSAGIAIAALLAGRCDHAREDAAAGRAGSLGSAA